MEQISPSTPSISSSPVTSKNVDHSLISENYYLLRKAVKPWLSVFALDLSCEGWFMTEFYIGSALSWEVYEIKSLSRTINSPRDIWSKARKTDILDL